MLEEEARNVERSRARDEERGRRIIEDYADTHPAAGEDPLVVQTWHETRRLQAEVAHLVGRPRPEPTAVPYQVVWAGHAPDTATI